MEIDEGILDEAPNEEKEDENYESKYDLPLQFDLRFLNLCKLFEVIGKSKVSDSIKIFNQFFKKCFSEAIKSKINLYNFFRLTFPKIDRARGSYGIKETFIGRLYSEILSLPDEEKLMLKHYKNPNYLKKNAPIGDFVGLVYFIIEKRVTTKSTITINGVNHLLNKLCRAQNNEERINVLTIIIKQCTAQEQKWIIKIILKDLKIFLGYENFFKNYDPRTLEIYNNTMSLVEVCNYIANPKDEKYANTYYQIFSPIKPMLAKILSIDNIISNFNGVNSLVETKFDGERIQCHLHHNEVKLFTRNGIDYTDLYGPKLSKLLISCVNAQSAILDGEIVVWDKKSQKFAPFGLNKAVALEKEDYGDYDICYEIFDIIFLTSPQGEVYPLNNVILSDRKKILSKVITPISKKIEIVLGIETNSVDTIMKLFSLSIEKGEEGVIIKKADSIYKSSERGTDWVKMKCEFFDTLGDTLDLLVIGGFYGEGRRVGNTFSDNDAHYSENVNTFLLGIIKEANKESPKSSVILPIVKIGTGYNMKELGMIRDKLKGKWKKFDGMRPMSYFGQWIPGRSERPDVYIEDPRDSIIFEVRASEFISSESFPTQVTLRFPRFVKYRMDKPWDSALNFSEMLEMYNISLSNKSAKNRETSKGLQHIHLMNNKKRKKILNTIDQMGQLNDDFEEPKVGKAAKFEKNSKILLDTFRDTDTRDVDKISDLFKGMQFYLSALDEGKDTSTRKQHLEISIVENGGEKVQNFIPGKTTHVIADRITVKLANLNNYDLDIIRSKWLEDCIKYRKIIPLSPMYLLRTSEKTKNYVKETMDEYGDSYYDEIDIDTLKELFQSMDKESSIDKGPKAYKKALNELRKKFPDIVEALKL